MNTVNVGKMNRLGFGDFELTHCATLRTIYTLDEESEWVLDSGASENLLSGTFGLMQVTMRISGRCSMRASS